MSLCSIRGHIQQLVSLVKQKKLVSLTIKLANQVGRGAVYQTINFLAWNHAGASPLLRYATQLLALASYLAQY